MPANGSDSPAPVPTTPDNAANAAKSEVEMEDNKIDQTANWTQGSLLQAVQQDDLALVSEIIKDTGYNIDETNEKNETPLLIATHNNSIDIAKTLIKHGANINLQDNIQDSPYLYAGAQGRYDILKFMLENATPDYTVTNRYGGNALIPAAEKGHIANVMPTEQ